MRADGRTDEAKALFTGMRTRLKIGNYLFFTEIIYITIFETSLIVFTLSLSLSLSLSLTHTKHI